MPKFIYTYGSEGHPFAGGWTEIEAADMETAGIRVEVVSLPYSQYLSALSAGDFHLYLGEVRLRADLDMTALFSGSLNYAKLRDSRYNELMDAYLASPEESRRDAARELSVYVAEDAAIVPILYKQRAVLTHAGVVSGARPGPSAGSCPGALSSKGPAALSGR